MLCVPIREELTDRSKLDNNLTYFLLKAWRRSLLCRAFCLALFVLLGFPPWHVL